MDHILYELLDTVAIDSMPDRWNRKIMLGVPVVAQRLTNPTRNHEVAGSIPVLAQWVNDPALP